LLSCNLQPRTLENSDSRQTEPLSPVTMNFYRFFLAILHAALSLGAAISATPESHHLEARKVAAELMLFPTPSCNSNGRIESITSDRCVSLRALRAKALVAREITSGCRGGCSLLVTSLKRELTKPVLAFENENCTGPVTRLTSVNRCYDMRNYTALVVDC